MLNYFILIFISIELLLIKADNEEIKEIKVSHTILLQESYYGDQDQINKSFIDFPNYKIYKINMKRIYTRTQSDILFELMWDEHNEISLRCSNQSKMTFKCADIDLQDHDFITFDYDRLIFKLGGVFSYLLILYGFFSLRSGYTYFNMTVIFYCTFGFILFFREFFELLELNNNLNSEHSKSERILITVFIFSLISAVCYGTACHTSKYLKYITFGFINGLIISKSLYYLLIKVLDKNYLLAYFLLELFTCLVLIVLFIFIQNKYLKFSIINICIIAIYGIIYGLNILFGGLPFIPFFILAKKYDDDRLFSKLCNKNYIFHYGLFIILLFIYGYYTNNINYKIATNKSSKYDK